ncbi:hypothetical protein [Agrobacterium pusense]|uniref:hypothetical protein n=1 Tax=Agrobacterium pusense TaxID=648995 RepID=UPI0010ADE785|nr:hypothetical protein [Agrobacterium pusense]WCK26605.1 hypothetical protein CFBP5496_0020610 [Agrobacterium pusense]
MLSKETNRVVELLAEKAVRRIQREGLKSHTDAVASSKLSLERCGIYSAVAAQTLHNRINDALVSIGLLRREANWLVAA